MENRWKVWLCGLIKPSLSACRKLHMTFEFTWLYTYGYNFKYSHKWQPMHGRMVTVKHTNEVSAIFCREKAIWASLLIQATPKVPAASNPHENICALGMNIICYLDFKDLGGILLNIMLLVFEIVVSVHRIRLPLIDSPMVVFCHHQWLIIHGPIML